MENAPAMILVLYSGIAVVILTVVLMIAGIVLAQKGARQNAKKMRFAGKLCLAASLICSIPIVLAVGYILYIYLT